MKLKLFTYVFCTFVFSQVFNYFNCRKIGQREINVFERIFTKVNLYFWVAIAFVTAFQWFMVQYLFALTRTTPLTRSEWGACIVAGAMVIPVAALLKLTGPGLLRLIPFTKFVDEDKEVNDGMVTKITNFSNIQVDIKTDAFNKKKKGGVDAHGEPVGDDYDDNYQRENNV